MRLVLFQKAKYFIDSKKVKITSVTDYSVSFEVGEYHVVGKYKNHQLIWLCDCRADANGDLCSHKIAAQIYLTFQGLDAFEGQKGKDCSDERVINPERNSDRLPYTAGLNHLTERQKEVLREMVEHRCQDCHKHQDEVGTLEVHRMKRGVDGGLYIPKNCKILCKECHDKYDY